MPLQHLHQKSLSCRFIAFLCDEGFEDLALLVDRTPQLAPLVVDFHEHLIKMPASLPISSHAIPLAPDVGVEQRPKPVPPVPNSRVADVDPAFEQQALDVPEAQWKPDIHQHHQMDHLRRGVELAEWSGRRD